MNYEIISSLVGGVLIGLSATMMLRLNGKIAGISGILEGSIFEVRNKDSRWKIIFLLGFLFGGLYLLLFQSETLINKFNQSIWLTILGGLLVGFGTRLGSGCTSGHGVCGVSRLSVRSIVATMSFMLAGFATVAVLKHLFNFGGFH